MKSRILIFGIFPPPLGGISNHILRAKDILEEDGNEVYVFDISRERKKKKNIVSLRNPIGFIKGLIITCDHVHVHQSGFQWFFLPFIVTHRILKHPITITYHSLRTNFKGFFIKYLFRFQNNLVDEIVAVNSNIKSIIIQYNSKSKVQVIPAFIPPKFKEKDFKILPIWILKFFDNHNPIITANAYKLQFYNGFDLYGLDLLIELCYRLKALYPDIGFVVLLSTIGNHDYYKKLLNMLAEKEIEKNFIIVNEKIQFYPFLMKSDIFIRPTNTDGDSISIRESLFFNIPTISSDVVKRPESTIIFQNRNINDLLNKTLSILKNM